MKKAALKAPQENQKQHEHQNSEIIPDNQNEVKETNSEPISENPEYLKSEFLTLTNLLKRGIIVDLSVVDTPVGEDPHTVMFKAQILSDINGVSMFAEVKFRAVRSALMRLLK